MSINYLLTINLDRKDSLMSIKTKPIPKEGTEMTTINNTEVTTLDIANEVIEQYLGKSSADNITRDIDDILWNFPGFDMTIDDVVQAIVGALDETTESADTPINIIAVEVIEQYLGKTCADNLVRDVEAVLEEFPGATADVDEVIKVVSAILNNAIIVMQSKYIENRIAKLSRDYVGAKEALGDIACELEELVGAEAASEITAKS